MPRAVSDRGRTPARPASAAASSAARIYAVVRRIPRGCVATYGEVAGLAGISSGHRVAARAMRVCPQELPWQRVLGKKDARRAHVSIDEPDHAVLQRALLEAEGVEFDASGCVPLARFGWLSKAIGPAGASRAKPGKPAKQKKAKKKRSPRRAASTRARQRSAS